MNREHCCTIRWRAAEPAAHPARRLDEGEDELEEQPGGQRDDQREGVLREGRKGARDGCHIVAYETPQSQIYFPGNHASHVRARNSWREFGLDFQ